MKLNVVFMGSGSFGIPLLRHLLSRADVDLTVVTQPDRPAGRGRATRPTPVADFMTSGAPVKKYPSVNTPEAIDEIRSLKMDLLIVSDFGQILKPPLLALPRLGPFNLHGSILPAYRGAAPIQRALLDGVRVTGVTLLWVNERCDAGPIVSTVETVVNPEENFGSLHDRLSNLAVGLLSPFLDQVADGWVPLKIPQDDARATMAPKIKKEELHVGFDAPADRVHNRIRAFAPSPGAYVIWRGTRLKLLKSRVWDPRGPRIGRTGAPGSVTVTADRRFLQIWCGDSTPILIEEVQPEGGRPMSSGEMINGHPDIVGALLK